jgi:hypothetical protein
VHLRGKKEIIMKLKMGYLFIVMLVILASIPGAASELGKPGWTTMNSALMDGEKIILTPNEGGQIGSAWNSSKLDLTKDFDMGFKIYLGTQDEEGADGIVFVLTNNLESATYGQGLGFEGITPSFGIEIDTYPNDGAHFGDDMGDPIEDHIAIDTAGSAMHIDKGLPIKEVYNLEDGKEHALRITWSAAKKMLRVHLDKIEKPVLEYTGDIVNDWLDGKSMVSYGFTGSTGMFGNLQYFVSMQPVTAVVPNPTPTLTPMPTPTPRVPAGQWSISGNAFKDNEKIILTPNEGGQIGAAWNSVKLDLSKDFDLWFNVYLGTQDEEGADGIIFILANDQDIDYYGQGQGYEGMTPWFGIEIDTYPNDGEHFGGDFGDPIEDHIAIDIQAALEHTGKNLPVVPINNVEDGKEHVFRVKWAAAEKTLSVYLDNIKEPVLTYSGDIVSDYLENQKEISYGFAGFTGMGCNLQYFYTISRNEAGIYLH